MPSEGMVRKGCVLEEAKTLIEKGWTQGEFAKDATGRQVRAGQAHDRRKELKDVLDGALFGRRP